PYGNALRYTEDDPRDLSRIAVPEHFLDELMIAAARFLEVLKPGGRCALLIGDLRRASQLYPLAFECVTRLRALGYILEELIIKPQHQDRSTEFYFKTRHFSLRLAHEYLLVFRKEGHSKATREEGPK